MKKEIAIIGYGRFGRCAAHHLKNKYSVFVSDVSPISNVERGVRAVPLTEAASKTVVILAVPINKLSSLLQAIAPHLTANALVCDVCSVKEQPVRWMKQILPKHVSILATHPLFGPDSAATTLRGRQIILSPVRISSAKLKRCTKALQSLQLSTHLMTPTEHDRLMASTLFLTQFVGRCLKNFPNQTAMVSTNNFRLLSEVVATSTKDSPELFRDMYRYNRFARAIPRKVLQSTLSTITLLHSTD